MSRMYQYGLLLAAVFLANLVVAQSKSVTKSPTASNGHRIEVKIKNFNDSICYLAYRLGDKTYIIDTVKATPDSRYIFEGKEERDPGVYLVLLPPKNRYFEFLLDRGAQKFSMETDTLDFVNNMKLKGTEENTLFFDYLKFLGERRKEAEPLQKELSSAKPEKAKEIKEKLAVVDTKVTTYQDDIIKNKAKSFTSLIIKANRDPKIPELKKPNGDVDTLGQFTFYKKHFWDNIDFSDDRLIRTAFLQGKIKRYLDQVTVKHPDSLSISADLIIEKAKANPDVYKYVVTELLNDYATSKIVGMDGVYVHIAKKYYCSEPTQTPWVEKEVMDKICHDANALFPLLLNKPAPDITLFKEDGSQFTLYGIKKDYVVLSFWDTECSHCQKEMPVAHAFWEKYANKSNVEFIAVCSQIGEGVPKCWKYINDKGWKSWINAVDPYGRYKPLYDLRTTPQIFILNKEKIIKMKKISIEQLPDVLDRVIEMDKKERSMKK